VTEVNVPKNFLPLGLAEIGLHPELIMNFSKGIATWAGVFPHPFLIGHLAPVRHGAIAMTGAIAQQGK
jgi:hypothetical protein